jgi:hypothetical protein
VSSPELHAQAAPATDSSFRWSVVNTTRVESWSYFDPPSTGGDPDYTFIANRLRIGVTGAWHRLDFGASAQYVQFGGLPTGAFGPGALGTGALYYDHSGRTDSRGLYVRTVFARARLAEGLALQVGRIPYQSGAESASGRPMVETVTRARIDSRLIGEFEWSLYQRSFDGVRVDLDRKPWHLTGAWFVPTQGGFEEDAGAQLRGIKVAALTFVAKPAVALPATNLSVFALHYDDTRPVTMRPDNSGLSAERVDVRIATFGASAVGSATMARGEADWLAWFAGQTGSWYSQEHHAWSLALESGYRWKARWQPWVRGGILQASGDSSAIDDRHRTFFPMLPTARKYAFTTAYAPMNVHEVFVELIVRPVTCVTARVDGRRLWLTESADLWYAGSGASQTSGTNFGYAGRRSGGSTDLGTVIEGAAEITLAAHVSLNGFFGTMHGGRVVRTHFAGDWLRFAYIESVVQF